MAELATARRYAVGLGTVVFNDHAFGHVKRTQQQEVSGHVLGTEPVNPDYVALAEAFGTQGVRGDGPAGRADVIRSALSAKCSCAHRGAGGGDGPSLAADHAADGGNGHPLRVLEIQERTRMGAQDARLRLVVERKRAHGAQRARPVADGVGPVAAQRQPVRTHGVDGVDGAHHGRGGPYRSGCWA